MRRILASLAFTALSAGSAVADDGLFEITWREIAKGVFVGGREDPLRYPVIANTTVVIDKKGVLVFDGGGYAAQGEAVLAKIRRETKKPVTHLVISHWHGDHHRGASAIIDAFPDAEIVAHRFTCAAIADGPEKRVEAGEAQLDDTYNAVADAVGKGEWFDGSALTPEESAYFTRMLADYPAYKAQLARMKVMTPTLAIDETMTIDLGKRRVTLLYAGLGNTAGDLALYLPEEKILATGDIVVAPVPYGFGSYPREWARIVRQLASLPAATIVPGHGPIMTDTDYLAKMATLLDHVADQAAAFAADNAVDSDQRPAFSFAADEAAFTAGDPVRARLFDMFFKQPIVEAALNEARGDIAKNEPLDAEASQLCAAD